MPESFMKVSDTVEYLTAQLKLLPLVIMWLNLDMAFPPKETSYMFCLGGFS